MQVSMFDGILVMTTSVKEIDRKYGEGAGLNLLFQSGGFMATVYEDDHEEQLRAAGTEVHPSDRDFIQTLRNTPFVIRISDAMEMLTEAEIEAVTWHEVGHIRCGHVEKALAQKVRGVLNNVEFEKEADAYAAARVSKAAMAKALTKLMIGLCAKINFNPTPVLMSADVRARINALQ